MSQSLLLQLARQSIQEVLEAERFIEKARLIEEHPILNEPIAVAITLYLGEEIRSHYALLEANKPLIEAIIYNAKVAAFELPHYPPLSTSEYLHVSLELSLLTPLEPISFESFETLCEKITPHLDGIVVHYKERSAYFMPENWSEEKDTATVINQLYDALHVTQESSDVSVYTFQTQRAKDNPILSL